MEKERESIFTTSSEIKSYDIQDIYDLEDCLDILDSVVQDLKLPNKKKSEISEVFCKQLMAKYIYMEDSILDGLDKLPKSAKTAKMQQRLLDDTQKFNELGCDFQDTWNNEYWSVYELTRDGYDSRSLKTNQDQIPGKTIKQISKELNDLQDMALVLSRMSRGGNNNNIHGYQSLAAIDEEAQHYSTLPRQNPANRSCKVCVLY